ncbi:hypothetical protein Bca4012_010719 [Brassica carinata]|uniref:Uncharacterized protein n=1 Tax=Brassica carinata TaxID=52824 RepID=A0A8X7S5Q3_BRACI|nr:hypothetical protein Bca52824_035627 [Brassica carinata]
MSYADQSVTVMLPLPTESEVPVEGVSVDPEGFHKLSERIYSVCMPERFHDDLQFGGEYQLKPLIGAEDCSGESEKFVTAV